MREYFQHDFYAMNDLRLRRLRRRKGLAGVGLWWCVVETLYQNDNVLHVEDFETIAEENGARVEDIVDLVDNYGLFERGEDEEGAFVFSKSIARRLEERASVAAKSQRAANGRWGAPAKNSKTASSGVVENSKAEIGEIHDNKLEFFNTSAPEKGKSVENSKIEGSKSVENSKNARALQESQTCNAPALQTPQTCNAQVEDVQCGRIAIKEKKRKEKEKENTTTTDTRACAGGGGGGEVSTTVAPVPLDGMEEARRECEAELRQLLGNDAVRLLLSKRTRFDTARDRTSLAMAQAYIPEFTAQEALNGRLGGEHGTRLAEHYVNWLAKKEQIAAAAPRETKEQRDERYFRETAGKLMEGLDLSQLVGGGN